MLNSPFHSYIDQQFFKKSLKVPTKTLQNTSIRINLAQTPFTSTCALSLSTSHPDRLLWTKSRGRNGIIPGIMWKLNGLRCINGSFQGSRQARILALIPC